MSYHAKLACTMEARSPLLGSGPSRTGQHCPFAQLERCDSLGMHVAIHIPLTQTRSFLTGQVLVHSREGVGPQSAAETGFFPVPSCALEQVVHRHGNSPSTQPVEAGCRQSQGAYIYFQMEPKQQE